MATATFQEFLRELEARKARPVADRRNEWVSVVGELLTQVEGWLKQLDPTGVFEVAHRLVEVSEPGLGHYHAPALEIAVGEEAAEVTPVGRLAGGPVVIAQPDGTGRRAEFVERTAYGRIDLANSLVRRHLFRMSPPGQPAVWWVQTAEGVTSYAPFDRERFAAALQDLFS